MARTKLYPASVDPGFPELPPTPAGWVRVTFGDALEIVERPIKLEGDNRYRLLTARRSRGGITLRGELLGREILTKTQFRVKAGDFVISRRQIIHGACGTVPPDLNDAVVSNEYSALRTKPGLLMDFLRHYSHTPYFQRTCFHSSHGVDVEKMIFKIDEWLKRQVDLPPLAEQRKIAAILSSVDEVIKSAEGGIKHLQIVKKAMMQELLTHGLPGRHSRFKKTEVGEIPEEWEVAALQSATSKMHNGFVGKSAEHYDANGIPYLMARNVRPNQVDGTTLERVSKAFFQANPRCQLQENDILVVQSGHIGTACVVPAALDGAACHALIVCTPLKCLDPNFAAYYLNSEQGARRLSAIFTGTTIKHINTKDLRKFLVPVPSVHEQRTISACLANIDAQMAATTVECTRLRALKNALMGVLLTGELRVTPEDAA